VEIVNTSVAGADVLKLTGRLDLRASAEMRQSLDQQLINSGYRLVIDLSEVEFIDSSALGVLIGIHRSAEQQGGRIVLVRPLGPAEQIFSLSRTDRFFTLATTAEEAGAYAAS
jgi:anti-sigma B factor antagonist